MKCKYALKKMSNESISVKVKRKIDEHISTCPHCLQQLELDKKVSDLIVKTEPVSKSAFFWQRLLNDVRIYRENRLSGWSRWLDIFIPTEPVLRKTAFAGVVCLAFLALYYAGLNDYVFRDKTDSIDTAADINFYLQEDAMNQHTDLFGGSAVSTTFASSIEVSAKVKHKQ